MRLSSVHDGDIVSTGGMHAIVVGREGRRLIVRGICNKSLQRVRADEVTGHWRRARTRDRVPAASGREL